MFQNIVGSGETEEFILNKDILIWHTPASELLYVLREVWFLLRYMINIQTTNSGPLFQKHTQNTRLNQWCFDFHFQ